MYLKDPTFSLGSVKKHVRDSHSEGLVLAPPEQFEKAGFIYHHVADQNQNGLSLAIQALEPKREDVGSAASIIYASCLPLNGNVGDTTEFTLDRDVKHFMDFPASRVQAHFGSSANVIGVSQQACTGIFGAIRIARALIESEDDVERVVCLTSDRFPPGARYEQAYNLISDGAASITVTAQPSDYLILAHHHITNGYLATADDEETVGSYFNHMVKLVQELCAKADISIEDVSWVVPQNTNTNAWQILSRVLNISEERLFCDVAQYGHMISGDNIVNLANLKASGRLKSGDILLLTMAGYGMNWQGILLEVC